MWATVATACGLYGSVLICMARNTRHQQTIMARLKTEKPLDDIVFRYAPLFLTHRRIRTFNDTVVSLAPLFVLFLAYYCKQAGAGGATTTGGGTAVGAGEVGKVGAWMLGQDVRLRELVLEFGALALYKMCVCIATRLPPATQHDNIRTHLGGLVATSSWIDYGISGHSGLTILLWLHLRTSPALVLALTQVQGTLVACVVGVWLQLGCCCVCCRSVLVRAYPTMYTHIRCVFPLLLPRVSVVCIDGGHTRALHAGCHARLGLLRRCPSRLRCHSVKWRDGALV